MIVVMNQVRNVCIIIGMVVAHTNVVMLRSTCLVPPLMLARRTRGRNIMMQATGPPAATGLGFGALEAV